MDRGQKRAPLCHSAHRGGRLAFPFRNGNVPNRKVTHSNRYQQGDIVARKVHLVSLSRYFASLLAFVCLFSVLYIMSVEDCLRVPPELVDLLKQALSVDVLPLALTDIQVAATGIRSLSSLRKDRLHKRGLPTLRKLDSHAGSVRYPVWAVLQALACFEPITTKP